MSCSNDLNSSLIFQNNTKDPLDAADKTRDD